ncbi:DUF488 domain-containing protein [Brevibacillus choshinensis]|uniref:DUF488 domain-containing protein n=1 Tax=Brevibacillus choshinensis TaxID=54911 RepID=UPI002E24CDE1|nr:DUF488 domain-containing protein [Brevibacillus choshinensis]MED4755042.1 DUF488 domain-containing protein [Brevibacillus choshinensis]MED4779588.1 DUF488 domain-containing protein [Brevibacillus choshinensis]
MLLTTIGFSKKSLRDFTAALQHHKVERVIDTRLQNTSQLAGYAKKDDLAYVLELLHIDYLHELSLAPTEELLKAIKQKEIPWAEFEKTFVDLLAERKVEATMNEWLGDKVPCFMCSEEKPHHCHRKLVVEYLKEFDSRIEIVHL